MYSTCLHCHTALGANDRIEHFPVGGKLAFDPVKGRLWVVCRACRRWNLTPIEERWEAIEECERLYRGTQLRTSTANIGLVHLPGECQLVRIGSPQTPEIAAWRYTGEFRKRWLTRGLPIAALTSTAGINFQVSHNAFGLWAIGAMAVAASVPGLLTLGSTRARVATPEGKVKVLNKAAVHGTRLHPTAQGWSVSTTVAKQPLIASGNHAVHTLRGVMTAHNFAGGRPEEVEGAISLLTRAGDPNRFIHGLVRATENTSIQSLPVDVAMALEMALHDGVERRALDGEIELLENEWALAEEIAGIADNMFVDPIIMERLQTLHERNR